MDRGFNSVETFLLLLALKVSAGNSWAECLSSCAQNRVFQVTADSQILVDTDAAAFNTTAIRIERNRINITPFKTLANYPQGALPRQDYVDQG